MRYTITIIFFGIFHTVFGQIEGKHSYAFLSLPPSARITSLGGLLPTVMDDDINLALANPASLNSKMHNQISFSHDFHFADIQNGYVGYGRKIDKAAEIFAEHILPPLQALLKKEIESEDN